MNIEKIRVDYFSNGFLQANSLLVKFFFKCFLYCGKKCSFDSGLLTVQLLSALLDINSIVRFGYE